MQGCDSDTKRVDFLCQVGAEVTHMRPLITRRRRTHRVSFLRPFAYTLALRIQQEHIRVHVGDGRVNTRIEALRGRPLVIHWRSQPHRP